MILKSIFLFPILYYVINKQIKKHPGVVMTTTSSMVHLSSTCKQRCCFLASFAFFILYKKSPLFSYKVKNKQIQKCIKTFMGKLSCHSGLTFQIYFQILLLSLSQATTSSAFGFHLESK